jgi:hypothetical protein
VQLTPQQVAIVTRAKDVMTAPNASKDELAWHLADVLSIVDQLAGNA